MEWIERLNKAVHYIEEHLTDEVDYEEAAKIACCSLYHFQRMFSYMADVPLSEYIRRRKMTRAAFDLQNSDEKIIDIALKYGYSSPTAFNRAFQGIHQVPPSLVREKGIMLKAYPPIGFRIVVRGAEEMNYRIEQREAFRIVGITQPMQRELEKNFKEVPKLWQKAAMEGTLPKLAGMIDGTPTGVLGVCLASDQEQWKYFIAVTTSKDVPEGMEEYTVPAFTWAIFSGEGVCPKAIQELEQSIVRDWLPTSGYEYDNGPDVEVYLSPDPQNAKFEVWIPVVKK